MFIRVLDLCPKRRQNPIGDIPIVVFFSRSIRAKASWDLGNTGDRIFFIFSGLGAAGCSRTDSFLL